MKKITLFSLLFTLTLFMSCKKSEEPFIFPDILKLSTQADIDAICEELLSIDTIPGALIISDFNQDSSSLITDLSCFQNISVVNGHLSFSLQNIETLEHFQNVTKAYEISCLGNDNLESIDLPLFSECQRITIGNNPKLKSINIPNGCPEDELEILNNIALESFNGLEQCSSIRTIVFQRNYSLSSLSGFDNLKYIQSSHIELYTTEISSGFMQNLKEVVYEFLVYLSALPTVNTDWLANFANTKMGSGFLLAGSVDPLITFCPIREYCLHSENKLNITYAESLDIHDKYDIIEHCD